MAAIRQGNWLGQERVDVRDLRALESAAAYDWDVFAGQMVAGERSTVLYGMSVLTTGAIGAPATNLRVNVADALLLHFNATDNGTIFRAPADRLPELLSPSNARVTGSWSSGVTNYVGIELIRSTDATTSDISKFFVPDTDSEIPKTVALARTLDYKFVISPLPFSARPTVLPIAKVIVDTGGNVTGIVDARELMFRLGRGGDAPNQSGYPWPEARVEAFGGNAFAGGDKSISSLKDWLDAAMTRIQEIGGGPAWYSATADRNVTMVWTGSTFTNGENFEWDGTNLHWKGLTFLFDNTAGIRNVIADQTTNSAGLTDLADGECIYVDLDRTQNLTGLVAAKAPLATLGVGSVPGSRNIIAWRHGASIYTRNWRYPVGTTFTPATTTSLGVVQLNQTPASALNPVVVSIMANGRIVVTASAGNTDAATFTGSGYGAGVRGVSVLGTGGTYSYDNAGVVGVGAAGVSGGAVHRLLGRPGVTGYGGSGAIGGPGGASFGGAGNSALDLNAGGGIGHIVAGGDGSGTGAGGVGVQALGGTDGFVTVRSPSFVAALPTSGPLPDIAFKSYAGSVELPIANTFRHDADKSGVIFLAPTDFQPDVTSVGKAVLFGQPFGSVATPSWGSSNTAPTVIYATIRVPRGAVINGTFQVLVSNIDSVSRSLTCFIQKVAYSDLATPPVTTSDTDTGVAVAAGVTNFWKGYLFSGSSLIRTAGSGSTANSDMTYFTLALSLPQTTNVGEFLVGGVRLTYSYRRVDFLV